MMKRIIVFCIALLLLSTAAGLPAAAETIKYRDSFGRTITFEVPVKRAVLYETYELMPAIGGFDRVVGLGSFALKNGLIRATHPEIAGTIPSVGTVWNLNIEALLKVKPDLVITFKNSNDGAVRFMENKGLKVLVIYPESLAELYAVMRLEGKIFAREKDVERVIREMEGIFKLIRNRVGEIPEKKRRRALQLMMKQTMVAGHTGITQDLFDLIGVTNCADSRQNYPEVSLERMVAWNPDLLYFVWYARYSAADIIQNPQWRHIEAIRRRDVYKIPNASTWSPRIAPVALWMAARAYPEQFKVVDVAKVIDKFYRDVYGISYERVAEIEN